MSSIFFDMFEAPKDKKLFQGDIIKREEDECDFFDGQEDAVGYLIVSNSCDIINGNIEFISLVPIYPFFKGVEGKMEKYKSKFVDQCKSKSFNVGGFIKQFENEIVDLISDEVNYKRKSTFFLSPLHKFGDFPTLATIEDVRSVPVNETKDLILDHRICSLKNPWRELLGFKVAYLYNRIATDDPPAKEELNGWWKKAYEKSYNEFIDTLSK